MCGDTTVEARIIGGKVIEEPGLFPWMAALYNETNQAFCAASLISSRYLLSSAHCFWENGGVNINKKVTVALAILELAKAKKTIPVENVLIHPAFYFSAQEIHNDIALIKLAHPVRLGHPYVGSRRIRHLLPICLSTKALDPNDPLYVTGWGYTVEDGRPSPILKGVDVPLVSESECKDLHGDAITEYELCAGGRKDKDACKGDSGGPLMWKKEYQMLVGITSYGVGCGRQNYYGVYAKVPKYLDWIMNNTRDSDFCQSKIKDDSENTTTVTPSPVTTTPIPAPIYPNYKNCGIPFSPRRQQRVLGGIDALAQEYPWNVRKINYCFRIDLKSSLILGFCVIQPKFYGVWCFVCS